MTYYQVNTFLRACTGPSFYSASTIAPDHIVLQIVTQVETVYGISMPRNVARFLTAMSLLSINFDKFGDLQLSCLGWSGETSNATGSGSS